MSGPPEDVPPPTVLERRSWAMFDFANSAFNTLVITFVYAVFFQNALVGDEVRGASLWSASATVCGLLVAVLAPVVGVWVDRKRGRKRSLLIVLSGVTIVLTALLAIPAADPELGRATESTIWLALILVTMANTSFELMFTLYNAFLPGLGDEKTVGRLSGNGWALGYVGGLMCLALGLGFVGIGEAEPWLSETNGWNVRATNLLVAVWFLVFALPMFVLVRDRGGQVGAVRASSMKDCLRRVKRTLVSLRAYPDLLRFLIARLFYNDAVIAITALAAIYMAGPVGMKPEDIILVAIWLNVVAGVGAFAFGWVDDKVGAKTAILWSVVSIFVGTVLAIAVPTPTAFWVAATLAGIGLGPSQSASRSLLARLISSRRSGEFYGLFSLTGKATTWLGPALFFLCVSTFESQRVGLIPVALMLVVGFVLMVGVDEQRGIQRSAADG